MVIGMDCSEGTRRHKELVARGWVRRFNGEEPRVSEMAESYRTIGLEVRIEPGMIGDEGECSTCFAAEGFEDRYKTIYTRGEAGLGADGDEDLFD
jgi:hypothetical protein